MGHSLAQWQAKIASYLRDAGEQTSTFGQNTAALRAAFTRFRVDSPRRLVAEAAGTGSQHFALPAGWVPGSSELLRVELPARQNPPQYLADEGWLIVESPTDVTVQQILTYRAANTGTYVRFFYTAPWPFPTATPTDDPLGDDAFEAVSALAASIVITGLDFDAARRRAEIARDADAKAGGIPDQSLLATAKAYEAMYLRFLGIDPTTPGTSTTPAVSRPLQFDPQRDSMFHGGRW